MSVCVHAHVCTCTFIYVRVTLNRDYLPSEKPIGYIQNEVLNRMLNSSGEVRAPWSRSSLWAVLSTHSRLGLQCPGQAAAQSTSKMCTWSLCWSHEGVTLSPVLGTDFRQCSRRCSASPLTWHPEGCSGDVLNAWMEPLAAAVCNTAQENMEERPSHQWETSGTCPPAWQKRVLPSSSGQALSVSWEIKLPYEFWSLLRPD